MIKENGTSGFNDSAVSVKILWKDIPESVIVADMPGMKDGDTAPWRGSCGLMCRGAGRDDLEAAEECERDSGGDLGP